MKTRYKKGGYSSKVASEYIDNTQPIRSLSVELEKQFRFEDGKPTTDITGYKAWFSQEGLPPFTVKFTNEIKLPAYLTVVEFDNLQGCEVNYNVYFKSDRISEVK
ncbi:MAG: hypothetical protein WBA84_00460 [Carnobacterium sp.]|uniref:hypothetical protein n=1 Tax=Carnobacterium sp. TaxID=48221 RepID=UPI003C7109C7